MHCFICLSKNTADPDRKQWPSFEISHCPLVQHQLELVKHYKQSWIKVFFRDSFCSQESLSVSVLLLFFTNTYVHEEAPSHTQSAWVVRGSQHVPLCVVTAKQWTNPHNRLSATVMGSSKLKRHSSNQSRKSTPNTLEETYLSCVCVCVVVWRGECVFSVSEQLPGWRRESRAG